jgi:phospholipid-transporting ATPase
VTAIIPLIFVLGVSLIREAIEDFARNNFDYLNNEEEVIVYRNNKFVKSNSKTLRLGEIILVYENQNIPTDMILIDTGYQDGICYVETSSLDGEKNLKFKVANKYTKGFINNDIDNRIQIIDKYIQPGKYFFSGDVRINVPNIDLNYINGTFHPKFNKKDVNIDEEIHITNNEFILKSSVLKNTSWIIGIVAYTGMNNKIILNSKKPRLKMSKVEKKLNIYLLFTCFVLIICCLECSISYNTNYKKFKKYYNYVLLITSDDINANSLVIFFTYFLLLNTLIPISLIVSIEIIKIIQGIFIEWDVLLYSKWRHCFCVVKTFSIIEELGNVNYIFCDKTGTLTKNELQFKYCIIDNKYYKYIKLLPSNKNIMELRSNNQES